MKIFIETIDHGIWNAIVNGPYVPMNVVNGVFVKSFEDCVKLKINMFSTTMLQRT